MREQAEGNDGSSDAGPGVPTSRMMAGRQKWSDRRRYHIHFTLHAATM
jgi:hypothetical protein